jgi:hypothetical protein
VQRLPRVGGDAVDGLDDAARGEGAAVAHDIAGDAVVVVFDPHR